MARQTVRPATAWSRAGSRPQSSSLEPVSKTQSQTAPQSWKTNSEPSQHTEGQLTDHWPSPEKGSEAKKQDPLKQAQQKANSKAGQLVGYKADSGTWGEHWNLNCHTSLTEELTKQLLLNNRRKKKNSTQPPGETMTELLLKYQHQDWMLEE
jgi:hypothetical protein